MNAGAKQERDDVVRDSAGRRRYLSAQFELADRSVSSILLTTRLAGT